MTAPVPALDPRPLVTMADMGMAGMDHGAMAGMGDMAGMDHSKMAGMGDDSMQGMSGMDGGAMKDSSGAMQGMSGMDSMQGMDHSKMSMGGMSGYGGNAVAPSHRVQQSPRRHASNVDLSEAR